MNSINLLAIKETYMRVIFWGGFAACVIGPLLLTFMLTVQNSPRSALLSIVVIAIVLLTFGGGLAVFMTWGYWDEKEDKRGSCTRL